MAKAYICHMPCAFKTLLVCIEHIFRANVIYLLIYCGLYLVFLKVSFGKVVSKLGIKVITKAITITIACPDKAMSGTT